MSFKLEYAWSDSRVKVLRRCMWEYYLTYFLSWEGWNYDADEDKKKAYMHKKMSNLFMFTGSVVHDEIQSILEEFRDTQKMRSCDDSKERVIQSLRKGLTESKNKKWESSPSKFLNLEEHFYKKSIDKKFLIMLKDRAVKCIDTFYNSRIHKMVMTSGKDKNNWLSLEDYQSFQLKGGEKINVKIDLALKHEGKAYLFDWKTGKISPGTISQLTTYAMYALKMGWVKTIEDVVIVPSYLNAYTPKNKDSAIQDTFVKMSDIMAQAEVIKNEYPMLTASHDNKSNEKHFIPTDNTNACEKCKFREMCKHYDEKAEA